MMMRFLFYLLFLPVWRLFWYYYFLLLLFLEWREVFLFFYLEFSFSKSANKRRWSIFLFFHFYFPSAGLSPSFSTKIFLSFCSFYIRSFFLKLVSLFSNIFIKFLGVLFFPAPRAAAFFLCLQAKFSLISFLPWRRSRIATLSSVRTSSVCDIERIITPWCNALQHMLLTDSKEKK